MIRARKNVNKSSLVEDDGSSHNNSADDDKEGSSAMSLHGNTKIGNQLIPNKTIIMIVAAVIGFAFLWESYTSSSKGSRMKHVYVPGYSLLSLEEDARLLRETTNGQIYHVIFSTDCGTYQHWQSYLTFYRAMRVKQPGHVTRIASGCSEEEKEVIEEWFSNNIQHMSQRFHLLLTPHFSGVKDENGNIVGDYKFFNKPFGLKYFLQNSPLLDYDGNGNFPTTKDDIIILIDPDMSILRPITKDFTSDEDVVIAKFRKDHILGRTVEHGRPFAQTYGFGAQWLKLDTAKIAGPDSPLAKLTDFEGRLYYPVGPPYIATVTDSYSIALKWTEFVPKVHEQYPHLLAEMFAYSLAAAHLDLKFQLIQSLMISDTHTGDGEGWALIDKMPADEVCKIAREADYQKHPLPHVVHLCQRYSLGKEWFFGKRRIPHDVFECENPLFEEPPDDVATAYDYKWPPNAKEKTAITPEMAKREAFMICHLTTAMNEAAEYYKRSACGGGNANLERGKKVADLFKGSPK